MNPLDQYFTVKALVKFINHWMAKIISALGIEMKMRSLEARHTFSTQLKRSGASTEYRKHLVTWIKNYRKLFEQLCKGGEEGVCW